MPIIQDLSYRPPFLFRNKHFNTIFPALFRKVEMPNYVRTRHLTQDDDFVDIDRLCQSSQSLVFILHGLEGSSDSQYMSATSHLLFENGYDVIAINHRSCSGEINRQLPMYNSGFTQDLAELVNKYAPDYESVYIVGFSLGGNISLKYTCDGIYNVPHNVKAVVSVSTPVDLEGCSKVISTFKNKLYDWNFLKTLRKKMIEKHRQFPDEIDIDLLKKVRNLYDFDEYFTAKLFGFDNAMDYYRKCSSLQFLENVQIPTLLINAKDDPFLSSKSYPIDIASNHKYLHLLTPKYGGHVGFSSTSKYYWDEKWILKFLTEFG